MFTNVNIKAQLYAIGAEKPQTIAYPTGNIRQIKLYAYSLNENNQNTLGKLKAISPDSTKGWTFSWFRHHPDSADFDTLGVDATNDSISYRDNLTFGCYIVRMTKGSIDTTFYAWIVLNKMVFHLVKTEDGYVKNFEYTCEYLDLRAVPQKDQHFDTSTWFYHTNSYDLRNPESENSYTFNNDITATITSKDTSFTVKKPSKVRITRIYTPPYEDTKFTVTFRDSLGNTATDEVIYKTINTKADFKMFIAEDTMADNSIKNYKDVSEGEAILWGKFINTSKNGVLFEWRLADSIYNPLDSAQFIRTSTDSTDTISDVIYRYPYKYKVVLISTSPKNCVDSATKELTVLPSKIGDQGGSNAFPKYFTPGGEHPYFGMKDDSIQSIRYIRLCIYNNRGNQIYEYKGKIADGWQGWDGTTKWGDAPPGIYYYYFEAEGWGPIESTTAAALKTKDKAKSTAQRTAHGKGYFYLFRSK